MAEIEKQIAGYVDRSVPDVAPRYRHLDTAETTALATRLLVSQFELN
jgi:hypothetical protein